jgi:hypothetical protein
VDAETPIAGESLEMPTGPPKTLDVGGLGGVTVLIAEPNSVSYPLLSLLSGLLCRLGTGRCRGVRMSGLRKRCASQWKLNCFSAQQKLARIQFMERTLMALALQTLGNPSFFCTIRSACCALQIIGGEKLQKSASSSLSTQPLRRRF